MVERAILLGGIHPAGRLAMTLRSDWRNGDHLPNRLATQNPSFPGRLKSYTTQCFPAALTFTLESQLI